MDQYNSLFSQISNPYLAAAAAAAAQFNINPIFLNQLAAAANMQQSNNPINISNNSPNTPLSSYSPNSSASSSTSPYTTTTTNNNNNNKNEDKSIK